MGVLGGFFNDIELIATIKKRGIPIFFEHDLGKLSAFLQTRDYFGSPWDPSKLFPDVAETEVEAAMGEIVAAPTGEGDNSVDEAPAVSE